MALLNRLANNQSESEDDELKSIIKNINNLLTTKRGYGFVLQDFGLSDYLHLRSSNVIEAQIIEEITQLITQYEPRVEVIKVAHIKDQAFERLSFAINCQVRNTNQPLNLIVNKHAVVFKVD